LSSLKNAKTGRGSFRERLKSGERLIGTIVSLSAPESAEIMREAGFDWLFLDAEHGPLSAGDLQGLMQGAGPGMPCLVRLSSGEASPIKQALDVGAAGIIAPMINTVEQAEEVVRLAKYPPMGERGVGLSRAHGYGLNFREYISSANEATAVVVQAEHITAVENIESITEVEGIDAVMVGPYDLSASMGRIGEVQHPEVRTAIDRVTEACLRKGIRLGVFGMSSEAVKPYIELGYTLIIAGVDAMLLAGAASGLLAEVKALRQNEP